MLFVSEKVLLLHPQSTERRGARRGVREFFESLKASKRKEVRRRRVAGRIRNTSVARVSGRGAGPEKTEKKKKVNNTKKSLILAQDER